MVSYINQAVLSEAKPGGPPVVVVTHGELHTCVGIQGVSLQGREAVCVYVL